jgi:hypothetical protein
VVSINSGDGGRRGGFPVARTERREKEGKSLNTFNGKGETKEGLAITEKREKEGKGFPEGRVSGRRRDWRGVQWRRE